MLLVPFLTFGQDKMSVANFELVPMDLTAIQKGTMLLDQNGDKCAIIKIKTTAKGLSFENGSLGIVKVDPNHTAETWVYIPHGSKKLSISHALLGQVTYDFPVSIESGKTYALKLTTKQVITNVFDTKHRGKFILNIEPKNDTVAIEGAIRNVTDGKVEQDGYFGTYHYTISSERYHKLEDTITINSEETPVVRNVRLKQAWGWLKFDNYKDLTDAHLYVDSLSRGIINSLPIDITSGTHVIRINKPLYKTFEETVVINDSAVTMIKPILTSDYGEVTIKVPDKNASIWIDEQIVGTGSFDGNLGTGKHIVECKKPNHRTTRKEIDVLNDHKQSFMLQTPVPIYTQVNINTHGVPVNIKIDDMDYESSGNFLNDHILIGSHNFIVFQKGYKTVTFTAILKEGEAYQKDITMEQIVNVEFVSKPKENAPVYIDGHFMGNTPLKVTLNAGKHLVRLSFPGYSDYTGKKTFLQDGAVFSKRLGYFKKNEFYVEGGGIAGNTLGYYGMMGIYIKDFNFEYLCGGSVDKSEAIYFNTTEGNEGEPSSTEFKIKSVFGGKIGYGLRLGGQWRITPQVGAFSTAVEAADDEDVSTWCLSGLVDMKIQYALTKGVSLSLIPEAYFKVQNGELYTSLAKASSKIKGWGTGFNVSLGLNLYL